MELDKRYKNGELTNADSIHFADSLKFYTLKEHRTVYGGGGIMPDVFVPLDTTKYTKLHRELAAKGLIINNSLRFVDAERKKLKREYKTFDDFNRRFEVPEKLIEDILKKAEEQGVKPKDDDEKQRTMPYLKTQLKSLIARDIWDMNEYFSVFNTTNDIVRKGLEQLENNN